MGKQLLEFYDGIVIQSKLSWVGGDLWGFGFILPDGTIARRDWIWFGSRTVTTGEMLERGDEVQFALASTPSKNGKMAASIVRPIRKRAET